MQQTYESGRDGSDATANQGSFSSTVRNTATQAGQAAAGKLDESRAATADGLESTAAALDAQADDLPGGEFVRNAAHTAAGSMRAAAIRVRQNDVRSMLGNMQQIVKNHPGASLLTAAALGFLLARALSRD